MIRPDPSGFQLAGPRNGTAVPLRRLKEEGRMGTLSGDHSRVRSGLSVEPRKMLSGTKAICCDAVIGDMRRARLPPDQG
jgi:hypothetical protein